MRPMTERLGPKLAASPIAPVGRVVAGVQVGSLLGWMSTRVLGQYDLLLIEDEDPDEQDIVYYVRPHIITLETHFGFPPREFRLWLALHEVTHRAQFTGVPWMRAHFLALVEASVSTMDPDPRRLLDLAQQQGEAIRRNPCPQLDGTLPLTDVEAGSRLRRTKLFDLLNKARGTRHVTAAQPISAMKSRRLIIWSPPLT